MVQRSARLSAACMPAYDYMACRVCGHVSGAMCKIWCPTTCQTDPRFLRGDGAFRPFSPFPVLRPPAPSEQMASVAYCKQISAPCVRALWAPFVQTYCRVTSHEYVLCYGRHGCYERAAFLLGRRLPLDPVWTERFTVLDCRG